MWHSLTEMVDILDLDVKPVIIHGNQGGLEPTGDYIVIYILETEQNEHAGMSTFADDQDRLNIMNFYKLLIQLTFVGDNAGDIAHSIYNHITSNPQIRYEFIARGLAPVTKSKIRSNPQLRNPQGGTEWIDTFNFDIKYNYGVSQLQVMDIITEENVGITHKITK